MKIVHPNGLELEFEDLASFICEGKRNGWASGDKPIKFTDGGEGYKYADSPLFYRDRYIGDGNFLGREIVFWVRGLPEGNLPLWGMNYSDTFRLPQGVPKEEAKQFKTEVFDFLKEQLRDVPLDFPFRGPVGQTTGKIMGREIVYQNDLDIRSELSNCDYRGGGKTMKDFGGNERILLRHYSDKPDFEIFNLRYHGRILVPDSYVVD